MDVLPQEAASHYATDLRWRVLPIRPRTKQPWCQHGVHDASDDPGVITRWRSTRPAAEWAVACGAASHLVVLDVDPRNGGDQSFAELVGWYGELPPTPTVATGGGGRHFYLRRPEAQRFRHKLAAGVDLQADGRYVVAPPSLHPSGNRYEWLADPWATPLADVPKTWLPLLCQTGQDTPPPHTLTHTDIQCSTISPKGLYTLPPDSMESCPREVLELILATLPRGPGERHNRLLGFIKALKSIDAYRNQPVTSVRSFIQIWHGLALPKIRTRLWRETWAEAIKLWGWADGRNRDLSPFTRLLQEAKAMPLPECVVRLGYGDDLAMIVLIKLCRRLQQYHGEKPFPLSCETAAQAIGVTPREAHAALRSLVADGELIQIASGNTGKASEWRYLGQGNPF